MIYRSRPLRAALCLTGLYGAWSLTLGPAGFRSPPSLQFLAGSHVPLQVFGVALLAYSILMVTPHSVWELAHIMAFALGALLGLLFTASYVYVAFRGSSKNGVATFLLADAVLFHVSAVIVSIDREKGTGEHP